jgi:hypothetical protein
MASSGFITRLVGLASGSCGLPFEFRDPRPRSIFRAFDACELACCSSKRPFGFPGFVFESTCRRPRSISRVFRS